MKIKVDKFCSLATSSSWQAWLYNFNSDIYMQFMARLHKSTGCKNNSDNMVHILGEIEKLNGHDSLFDFLKVNYPHVIVYDEQKKSANNEIFEHYDSNVLTYPHRYIIEGDDLSGKINRFIKGKAKTDFVVVDGRAYIEYLNADEVSLVDAIPSKNWRIRQWRLKNNSANL